MTSSVSNEAHPAPVTSPLGRGVRRSVRLFQAFRLEQSDPDAFYGVQAADTMAQIARDILIPGSRVLDVGGGGGYFSQAFGDLGASAVLVEPEAGSSLPDELLDNPETLSTQQRHDRAVWPGRLMVGRTIAGDGNRLPFADNTFDLAFSSNVLEHVPDPLSFIEESIRVTKPGGFVYISHTAWFSPWGGHETSPWHYLGGRFAARRYERRNQRPPGNLFGTSLYRCDVGTVMKLVHRRADVVVVRAEPRYYPEWLRWIVRVPILRELATWNLAVTLRVL
ncbi:MAG: class I SAM-dependent methyltransferase [Actinomycetes bacterium]